MPVPCSEIIGRMQGNSKSGFMKPEEQNQEYQIRKEVRSDERNGKTDDCGG